MHIFLRPPEGEVSTLLLSFLKEMGGMVLMLAALPWLASRNPVRNVAVLDRAARRSRSALLAEAAGDAGSLPGISDEWPFSGRVGRGPA